MKYHLYQDVFSGIYYADLLGGEFSNCYGEGDSEESAVACLRNVVSFQRKWRKFYENANSSTSI